MRIFDNFSFKYAQVLVNCTPNFKTEWHKHVANIVRNYYQKVDIYKKPTQNYNF